MTSNQEKQRLQAVYASMAEGELRKAAEDAGSLTDEALEALEDEIDRRSLDIPLVEDKGRDAVELRELVTIRKFRDLPEAILAKGVLESAGLECFLADDNLVRMDWFISNFVGGIKLQVKPEDAAAANEVLEQPIPEQFEVEEFGEYHQPECPKCGSLDTVFEELNKPIAYTSAWIGVPIPVHQKGWQCKSCGYHWDDEVEDTEAV